MGFYELYNTLEVRKNSKARIYMDDMDFVDDVKSGLPKMDRLRNICRYVDAHTVVRPMDYSASDVFHCTAEYPNDPSSILDGYLCGLLIPVLPVCTYISQDHKTKIVSRGISRKGSRWDYSPGKMSIMAVEEKLDPEERSAFIRQIIDNRTIFRFIEGGQHLYLIFSEAAGKTFTSRFKLSCDATVGRDLSIAEKLGDSAGTVLYTVMRTNGSYNTVIGFFGLDPKRASWTETVDRIADFADGTCLGYRARNDIGLLVRYSYDKQCEAIAEIEGETFKTKLLPAHQINVCDSGNVSDGVTRGWYLENNPKSMFFTGKSIIEEGNLEAAIEENMQRQNEEIRVFDAANKIRFESREEFLEKLAEAIKCSQFFKAGKKAVAQFQEYASSRWTPDMTILVIAEAIGDELFQNLTKNSGDDEKEKYRDRDADVVVKTIGAYSLITTFVNKFGDHDIKKDYPKYHSVFHS